MQWPPYQTPPLHYSQNNRTLFSSDFVWEQAYIYLSQQVQHLQCNLSAGVGTEAARTLNLHYNSVQCTAANAQGVCTAWYNAPTSTARIATRVVQNGRQRRSRSCTTPIRCNSPGALRSAGADGKRRRSAAGHGLRCFGRCVRRKGVRRRQCALDEAAAEHARLAMRCVVEHAGLSGRNALFAAGHLDILPLAPWRSRPAAAGGSSAP